MALGLSASAWAEESDDPLYPETAKQQGMGGRVTLDCVVVENGRLSCQIVDESPLYWEFGDAALEYSHQWRMDALAHNGQSTAGGRLRRMLIFEPGPPARIYHGWPPRPRVGDEPERLD